MSKQNRDFIRSWQEVERLVVDYYVTVSQDDNPLVTMAQALKYLHKSGIIDDEMSELLNKFRSARNQLVHSQNPTDSTDAVGEWLKVAVEVKQKLAKPLS